MIDYAVQRANMIESLQRGRRVDRTTPFDLERLARVLSAAGAARVEVSDDAGGYVCERAYYELLEAGQRLGRPALFLHVPPAADVSPEAQAPIVRALVAACLEPR